MYAVIPVTVEIYPWSQREQRKVYAHNTINNLYSNTSTCTADRYNMH